MRGIGNEIQCPAGCAAGRSGHIKTTTPEFLGFRAEDAQATRLNPGDELFICTLCGCVWRRFFDTYILRYRSTILGTSTPLTRFFPAPWLNKMLPVNEPE